MKRKKITLAIIENELWGQEQMQLEDFHNNHLTNHQ